MSFPAYPAYRESGVEWIGPVPARWSVTRLRFLAQVQTGIAKGKDVQGIETIRVPYLRVANVQDGFIDTDDVSEIEIAATDLSRYLLRPGDVLMNEGGDFDKLGRGQVWNGAIDPCIHQNHVFAVRPHGIEPEWLALVTSADCGRFFFMMRAKQSTNLASISSTNLLELPVPCPPPTERRAIMRFLDRECGKLDALVAEQERLIALLKEKRQAVISDAVTKGLDPNAPMKDSGIAWLKQVPAHWEVKRLKFLVRPGTNISYGIVQPGDHQDDGVPFVQTTNMSSGDFEPERLQRTAPEIAAIYPRTCLEGGEVLLGIRASIGAAHVVPPKLRGANLSRGVARIVCDETVSSDFLVPTLRSDAVAEYWALMRQGSTFNEVSIETVRELSLALPPLDEQMAICRFVRTEERAFDNLTTESERAIALLKERRAALISAAVTGKIDVRGLVTPAEARAA